MSREYDPKSYADRLDVLFGTFDTPVVSPEAWRVGLTGVRERLVGCMNPMGRESHYNNGSNNALRQAVAEIDEVLAGTSPGMKSAAPLPAAPAPTEQAAILTNDEISKVRAAKRGMVNAMIASGMNYGTCGVVSHHLENLIAALAARQAPPELHKDFCQRCLRVHASVDCAPADLARLAPDSRDALIEQAAKIAMDGPLLTSAGECLYFNDNCRAMALMVANRIRALKGPAQ